MPNYVSFPIDSDPQTIYRQSVDYIQTRSPAWVDYDGNLDTWILQVLATEASDLRILASDVPTTIFRFFGGTILGIPPQPAVQALVHSTWSAIDLLGHLIPAGTTVGIRDNGGTLRGFQTVVDVSIIPGLDETDAGEVLLQAIEGGLASDGIGGPDEEAELIDPLEWVDTVVLTELSSGGSDAESIDDYTNRLAEYMRGLSTRPILPEDYARLAQNFPGVYRAVCIDGYDPSNDTYFNDKMVTIVAVDPFGLDLPTEVKEDLDTFLQGMREVNFIVNVIDASRTTIDVEFEAKAISGFSTSAVEAEATANVTDYLSPMNWGFDPSIIGGGSARTWVETPFVYYNSIMKVLSNTSGLDHVTSLRIGRSGEALSTNDISLDLPAALTEPGNIDGTVT